MSSDVGQDSADRYADAVYRRNRAREAWNEAGQPLLAEGGATGRASVPHPLWTMLKEADLLCDRLAKSLRPALRGRPPGSASAPDRVGEPPRVKLKVVDAG